MGPLQADLVTPTGRTSAVDGPAVSQELFTDLYQLTMAQAYWQAGQRNDATFSLLFRSYPPNRGYMVLAGVEDTLGYLADFGLPEDDVQYLRSTNAFAADFLDWLADLRFTGSVRAMAEGEIFFAGEPVIEVTAPIIEAQIVETAILNLVNHQTLLATKSARVVDAARGRTLVDFTARRTHGREAADHMARVSYMTGFAGTSNVRAGRLYGVPTFGTMAHSFVESFETEQAAFDAYAASFPESATILVDTYDTETGVTRAIDTARRLSANGHALRAIRLDSGDLLELSTRSRAMLDKAGLHDVQIFASGGLDEFEVDSLLSSGAPIDGFGVGTKVGVSADAPWSDCAYKLVQYGNRPTLKLSTGKQTAPGPKQVFRFREPGGLFEHDTVGTASETSPGLGGEPLLKEVMCAGHRKSPPASLTNLRRAFAERAASLPPMYRMLSGAARYPVSISPQLQALTDEVVKETSVRELGSRATS